MSTAYLFINIAAAAAFRMGLHMGGLDQTLSEHTNTMKRRVFVVLKIMDTHVAAVLGVPPALRGIVASQDPSPDCGHIEYFQRELLLTDMHAKLVNVLANVVENVYPAFGAASTHSGFYAIPHSVILDIEKDLDEW